MHKTDKREAKRQKARYGHFGAGASHTREASHAEVKRHIAKARNKHARRHGRRGPGDI